jgi:DNA-binding protein H-NS
MSLKELVDLQARLKKAIAEARQRERSEVKEKSGSTRWLWLLGLRAVRDRKSWKRQQGCPQIHEPGQQVRDLDWPRGRQPRWHVAKLAKGAKLEQFKI